MHVVGIDCRFAATNSGIGRYTRELTTRLLRRADGLRYVLFVWAAREAWIPGAASGAFSVREADIPHYSVAEHVRLPRVIKSAGIDLLFSPHFNVPVLLRVPTVVTLHDLILHRYPNSASVARQAAYRLLLGRSLSRAQRIIAVSGFTAREALAAYGPRVEKKLVVIHEGVGEEFAPRPPEVCAPVLAAHGIRSPFFLYVGNAKQHKNVQMLIDAFADLHDPESQLVLVTGGREASSLRLEAGVRLLPSVSDAELPALYSSARCFVSASLYEGFGLPLLEAHACGCPGIVTDCGSFPEIAPSGTVVLPPERGAFRAALASPPPRPSAIVVPSWDEAAARTAAVFHEALRGL